MKIIKIVIPVLILTIALWAANARLSEKAPDFKLKDVSGEVHELSDYKGKYVVLEWVNFGCPFVKKHYNSGNMQALQKKFTEKGVVWLSVCSSAPGKQGHYQADELQDVLNEKGVHHTAYLIDEDGTVGRKYGAKTTPHMYIINPKGTLVYAGAIDDKPSTKLADVQTADNYVVNILQAALADKEFEPKSTSPYGCSVKYD
ncbi:MAG: redoxin domain-containing protein [Caldithrix sp.]|nr:redoxin domain-containing protein [Caldithrix sp.]